MKARDPHGRFAPEPLKRWDFFIALGQYWRAVGHPEDRGGCVGMAVRAGVVATWKADSKEPDARLEEAVWVRLADVDEVLRGPRLREAIEEAPEWPE